MCLEVLLPKGVVSNMLLCVLALSHFSITSTADVAPLLREALYDEVYVRLHGAEFLPSFLIPGEIFINF